MSRSDDTKIGQGKAVEGRPSAPLEGEPAGCAMARGYPSPTAESFFCTYFGSARKNSVSCRFPQHAVGRVIRVRRAARRSRCFAQPKNETAFGLGVTKDCIELRHNSRANVGPEATLSLAFTSIGALPFERKKHAAIRRLKDCHEVAIVLCFPSGIL
jgi:hypothetical protein